MSEKTGNDSPLLFKPNERILCFHGPLLYEAKVVKAEMWDGRDADASDPGPHYFVHYKGWKQTWDEWVDESRALKFNEENLAKQKALKQAALQARGQAQQHEDRERKRVVPAAAEESQTCPGVEREEGGQKGPEVKLPIPNALKAQLVDDWERITKDKLLVPLPRDPSVAQMLMQYQESRRAAKDKRKGAHRDDEIVDEVIDGLKVYFDRALGNILLYRFERYQYKQMREKFPDKPLSEIYGAEHLLRLFVQLPNLIAHTNMDDDAVQLLKENLSDILKYMHKYAKTLFAEEYENASPAYVAIAKAT
ncbi:MRG-domain-containing protein [Coemansia spiralis]|nr:MRG-domain-containing protein [Coemansia spiralis]